MTRILMHGYQGKMGKVVLDLITSDPLCEVAAGVDICPSQSSLPYPTYTKMYECDMPADVIIDFSTSSAIKPLMDYAVKKKIPVVVCTTGVNEEGLDIIKEASKTIGVFKSANMSIGINLITNVLKKISASLYEDGFDIEIIEKHHRHKIDAPSGTALLLADSIDESLSIPLTRTYDRSNVRQPRQPNEIGIHTLRGGSIVGEHSVVFAGKDEVIELTHIASSKEIFALGALKAAKYMVGKGAGLYNMEDIMNEL